MFKYRKTLDKSITAGCILFTTVICITLCILNYTNQKGSLYQYYESYMKNILEYVDKHIDDEDLKNVWRQV